MKFFSLVFIFILIFNLFSLQTYAQKDVSGSKDHPIISRYDGAWIVKYEEKEFETFEYPISTKMEGYGVFADTKKADGKITSIEYNLPEGVTATQVFRNYKEQIKKSNLKITYECEKQSCGDLPLYYTRKYAPNSSSQLGNAMIGKTGSYLVAQGNHGGQEYLLLLVVGESSREKSARYRIDVIRKEELDLNKVSVADMEESLEKEGKMAFYGINFDFNSATIQESSKESLEVISDYLKNKKDVQVFIVGHTDNVGTYSQNLALSQKRADAIVDYLSRNFSIDKSRMTPVGVSMVSPVASNTTEEGRAKNRRVEVVIK